MREGTFRRVVVIAGMLCVALLIRNAIFVQLRLFNALPELVLLVVVAVAVTEGPETAAVVGFAGGLLQDFTNTQTPVGLSCLSFVLVGFAIGLAHSYVIRPGRMLPIGLALMATWSATVTALVVGAVIGQEYLMTGFQFRVAFWASIYSAAVFPAVMVVVRRVMELAGSHRAVPA